MMNHDMTPEEQNATRQAHLTQASVHIVDAIANIQAAGNGGDVSALTGVLKGVLGECTAELLHLQRIAGSF